MHSPAIRHRLASLLLALCTGFGTALAGAQEIPARLNWAERLDLGTPVSGVVTHISAEPGQTVKRGAVLVQLDDRGMRADLEEAEARVRRLEMARSEAELEFERARDMYDRTLISQRDLSLAEIGFAMADAEFVAAKARLTRARLDLEYSRVRAPFDGLVLARHVHTGQAVNNELQVTPLVTLVTTDPMVALGLVPEERLGQLREGQSIQVRIGEQRYNGTLRSLGLEPEAAGSDYPVTVHFSPSGDHRLRAGQRATLLPNHD